MKKGFTLVELLAVIVIIGLLMTLAIPAVLKVSGNVKQKSYETKIEMIEDISVTYGDQEKAARLVPRVKTFKNTRVGDSLTSTGNELWLKVQNGNFSTVTTKESTDNIYPAFKVTIEELVNLKQLTYDVTDNCKKKNKASDTTCTNNFNNIVTNPVNDNVINKCNVYIYYKNNRVYAHFDKTTCDDTKNYNDPNLNGHEYRNVYA